MAELNEVQAQIAKLASENPLDALAAIHALKNEGGKIVPELLVQLRAAKDPVRTMLVIVLGELGPLSGAAAEQVAALLDEDNEKLRMAAALTLVRIGSESVKPLQQIWAAKQNQEQHQEQNQEQPSFWAAWALSIISPALVDDSILERLEQAQKKPDTPVEASAAKEALDWISANRVEPE
ncbi:hypothetical protein BBD42_30270 [Paenibacillus sp. BIHB 4019]|uniref:HEAT repeat domain-containing protein n=1 Tax=Paenibacillus sp. BIHB 4019 TaxID=1870819 RepID=A0A1B2DRH0_9BACL|nr:HEAT repeat domain-containing protein [Paenibacillus sp. BIHB 4019]ANY70306.1 hypothetical protein BBD42_30270 [Paenibacillus sp. BIHB 4019]